MPNIQTIKKNIRKEIPNLYSVVDWKYFENGNDDIHDVKYSLLKGVVKSLQEKKIKNQQLSLQKTFIPKARKLIGIKIDPGLDKLIFIVPSKEYIPNPEKDTGDYGITIPSWNNAVFISSEAADFCTLDNNNIYQGNVLVHEMIHQTQPNADAHSCFSKENGCKCRSCFIEIITIILAEKILKISPKEKAFFSISSTKEIRQAIRECSYNKDFTVDNLRNLSIKNNSDQKEYLNTIKCENFVEKWHENNNSSIQKKKQVFDSFEKNLLKFTERY